MFPKKLDLGERRLHQTGQRVSDIGCPDARAAEKCLFKRKNAQEPVHRAPHGLRTPFSPSPGLGSHQVDHRHAQERQTAGHPQVEIGGIGENGDVRPGRACGGQQLPVFAVDAQKIGHDFEQADDG